MNSIMVDSDIKSPLAEAIRTLRTNIQFMNPSKGMQTILVTSTLASEGKSWVSSNLAAAFAQTGKTTVIIDADMRKGVLNKIFDLPLTPGLSNYLSGVNISSIKSPFTEHPEIGTIIQRTEIENLFAITLGDLPPNPSELILAEEMNNLIDELRDFADVVIFDGTPSLLVTDSIILSRLVNSTIIVAEYNRTKKNDLKQVKEAITNVGGKVAGIVLNKIPFKTGSYYG